jgi:sugar transferase (PEP-CTERM system associated)
MALLLKHGRAALRRVASPAVVLLLVDALILILAFYLAVWLRFDLDLDSSREALGPLLARSLSFTTWVLIGLLSMGLYRGRQRPTSGETAVRVLLGVILGGAGNILFFYLIPSLSLGRAVMVIGLAIATFLLVGAHLGILRVLDASPIKRRVLVVGAGLTAEKLRLRRRADRRGFDIVAFVAVSESERLQAAKLGATGVISLEDALSLRQLDEIVVALDDRRESLPLDFLLAQKKFGVPVSDIMDFLERETERLDLDILRPSWLLYEKSSQTDMLYRWLKRLFDLVFSSGLLILASPILIMTVIAIRAEEGRAAPLIYRQRRVGRNGVVFELMKFRSMRVNAEQHTGPRFSTANDERVTKVGRLIRRFRIDELPQLWNVILGDMSVVGPRPERPEFVEILSRQEPLYFYRHSVRPGVTGWAQLNFPYGASLDDAREKLTYDLYYIKNTNIVTDLLILMQTLEIVAWGRGTSMSGGSSLRPIEASESATEPADPAVVISREHDVG